MSGRPVVVLEALAVRARPTGVAAGILELLEALAGTDRGCDFVVAAGAVEPFAVLDGRPGWSVRALGTGGPGGREWARQVRVPALCRELGAALVHSLQPVAPLSAPCPVVLTVHDMAWRTLPAVIEQPRRAWLQAAVPASLRRAELLLANSGATAAALSREFPALASRVRVVPHGTPGWALAGRPPGGPTAERPYFLFVGTLEPRKNLPRLLDAYESLLQRAGGQAPDLCLAGPMGWGAGQLRERLARPSLAGRVRLAGWCAPEDLRSLYAAALALVFPSLDEGFGLPIVEAMGFGLPVLTSAGGATAEVAGSDALLVDPLDTGAIAGALARLATDEGLRARLACAGPQRARAWTWARTADLTAAAYAEILGREAPRK